MNNREYKDLIEKLNDLEAIAYGYNINGEVLGMDCSDFEQIMVDSTATITYLQNQLSKVTAERDAAVRDLRHRDNCDICIGSQNYISGCNGECLDCNLDCRCKDCRNESKWEWRGIKEE